MGLRRTLSLNRGRAPLSADIASRRCQREAVLLHEPLLYPPSHLVACTESHPPRLAPQSRTATPYNSPLSNPQPSLATTNALERRLDSKLDLFLQVAQERWDPFERVGSRDGELGELGAGEGGRRGGEDGEDGGCWGG